MNQFSRIEDVGTVRLKIIESCNWSCNFCHNEGDIDAGIIKWNTELESALCQLRDTLNIKELHLTGGEPSLNKHISSIISGAKNIGMIVKMTSNGQFSADTRNELMSVGIDAVNFSLQSIDPRLLQEMMIKSKNYDWASEQIKQAQENIVVLSQSGG